MQFLKLDTKYNYPNLALSSQASHFLYFPPLYANKPDHLLASILHWMDKVESVIDLLI